MAKRSARSEVSGRSIIQERTYAAPRELVWELWTQPKHLDRWWGPNGFRNETKRSDFRVGGAWTYVMHGPDGKSWPNSIRYQVITPLERLEYAHGGEEDGPAHFHTVVTFETVAEGTRVTMTATFPSEAMVAEVSKYAVAGGMQNLARLVGYLPYVTESGKMILSRYFESSPAAVFAAWSTVSELKKWWGPLGFTLPECEVDFRVGGRYRMTMADGAGGQYPFHGEYLAITANERIVFDAHLSNAPGDHIITEVTFTPDGEGTVLTVTQTTPADAGAAKGQLEGWNGSLIKLGELIR